MMDRFFAYEHHCMIKPRGSTFPMEDLHILTTVCSKYSPSSSSMCPLLISSQCHLNGISIVKLISQYGSGWLDLHHVM